MENNTTASLIASRRKALGMTQQALADKLHITNKAVSKWETGEGLPDISILRDLAQALEISVDELLNGVQAELVAEKTSASSNHSNKIRIFRIAARAFLLLLYMLPFVSVPLSQVMPEWLGIGSIFDSVFGNSLQASISGFEWMLTISLPGILLILTFISQLTLLLLDLIRQIEHPTYRSWIRWANLTFVLIALVLVGFCLINSLTIQIGLILFVVFTLSLGLQELRSPRLNNH